VFDIYTIIFLALAVFIFLRLRSVLGQRTGRERPPYDPYATRDAVRSPASDKIVTLPQRPPEPATRHVEAAPPPADRWKGVAESGSSIAAGLDAVAAADPAFDAAHFITGARTAYEMIVTAFAQGDRKTLKTLLEKEVYDGFDKAIADREALGHKIDFTFVGLPKVEISDAELDRRDARVAVRFNAEVVQATKNKDGQLIDGNAEQVQTIADEWTFARSPKSRDPNWKLVATNQLS